MKIVRYTRKCRSGNLPPESGHTDVLGRFASGECSLQPRSQWWRMLENIPAFAVFFAREAARTEIDS